MSRVSSLGLAIVSANLSSNEDQWEPLHIDDGKPDSAICHNRFDGSPDASGRNAPRVGARPDDDVEQVADARLGITHYFTVPQVAQMLLHQPLLPRKTAPIRSAPPSAQRIMTANANPFVLKSTLRVDARIRKRLAAIT